MEKEWIPIVGTLGGVLIGGGIASFAKWLELRHQRKQERNKLVIAKLEELHAGISDYINTLLAQYREVLKHTYKSDDTQNILQISDSLMQPLKRMGSTLNIYFPSGAFDWSGIQLQITEYNGLCIELIKEGKQDPDALHNQNNEIYKSLANLLERIEKESRKYTGLK